MKCGLVTRRISKGDVVNLSQHDKLFILLFLLKMWQMTFIDVVMYLFRYLVCKKTYLNGFLS